jgi:asparagine synthase (glutamine-hydrolysing)
VYEAGTASVRRYWRVGFPAPGTTPRRSAGEWAEGLRERLEESVRLHLRSDVPVGAWLSPGIDSSTVAALARRALGHPLPTFTLGFDDPDADELRGARTLPDFHPDDFAGTEARCTVADFQRYPRALWHTEVPSAAGIEVPRMVISEAAAHAVKVVLTGEGADEVLGGYPWYRGERALAPLGRLPAPVRRWIAHRPWIEARWPGGARVLEGPSRFGTERYLRLINAPATTDALEAMLSADHRAAIDAVAAPDGDRLPSDADWPRFQKLQAYDLGHRLEAILHRVDRASMAHSLEVRVPFLDQEVVEFCAAIPPSVKLGWRREKEVLRRAVRDLLPPEIVRRRKRGMRAPFRTWLRGPLPAFAEELLSPASIREKGYFDPAAVARLVATDRDARWTRSRLAVLTIQLWDEIFRQGWRPPYWTP